MTDIRSLFLSLVPSVWTDPLDATAGLLLDIAAERALRSGTEDLSSCEPMGSLCFVGDDVRDRAGGRIATLPAAVLEELESYTLALHERIAEVTDTRRGSAFG
jgi:hypothetical protein